MDWNPLPVLRTLMRQLQIDTAELLPRYRIGEQRWRHSVEIRSRYGFQDWSDPRVRFQLIRWLYAMCWTGTDRPGILFDRATSPDIS